MPGLILPPSRTAATGLVYVAKDKQYQRTIVTGRFDCERDEWFGNPLWRKAAILGAWVAMVEAQEKLDSTWTGDQPRVVGPLEHIDFSSDTSADDGPLAHRPDPRDRAANDAYERAERALVAKRAGLVVDRVDFTLTAPFKRRVKGAMRVHIPEAR